MVRSIAVQVSLNVNPLKDIANIMKSGSKNAIRSTENDKTEIIDFKHMPEEVRDISRIHNYPTKFTSKSNMNRF